MEVRLYLTIIVLSKLISDTFKYQKCIELPISSITILNTIRFFVHHHVDIVTWSVKLHVSKLQGPLLYIYLHFNKLIAFLIVHTKEKLYHSLMYITHANASNSTPLTLTLGCAWQKESIPWCTTCVCGSFDKLLG